MADNKINVGGRLHSIATGNVLAGANEILDDDKNKKQNVINAEVDIALADRYTKEETYNKNELDSLITTPDVQYVPVTATEQTTVVTDVLPATGAANTIYRVGNWDGSKYTTTVYSEYAWNGSTYVLLNVKEYGIDDEPTAGSDNLVKSGGIASAYGSYIENPEFVYVKTDNKGRILWAIKIDGSIYYGTGVPQQVIDYIEEKIAELSLDEYEDIVTFLADLEKGDKTLQDLLDKKVDGEYVENPEYIEVKTDKEDKVLEGIQKDGTKVIGGDLMVLGNMEVSGVSYKVIENPEYLAAWVDAENKVIFGFKVDGKTYVGDADFLDDIESIKAFLANFNDKNIDWDALTSITAAENPEFMGVELDADDKVLSGRKEDGTKFENNDVELNGNATIGGSLEVDGLVIKNIEDPEGRLEIATDSENKILSYRKEDGTKVEEKLKVNSIALTPNSIKQLRKDIAVIDWSNKPYIEIDIPKCAIINFSNIATMPTSKTSNAHAYMEFWDMQGNYFKVKTILNAQGDSSLSFTKKNLGIDICTESDNWQGDDTVKVKFGDWVSQDSFHIKAYTPDTFRCSGAICYKLYNQIMETGDVFNDRPYKQYYVEKNTTIDGTGKITQDVETNARCVPDGFPCIVYLNGEFYGIYAFQLKKHRDNYQMKKNNAKHIHLDGTLNATTIFGGTIDWTAFEVRNPKSLKDIDGNKYDGDHPKELSDSDAFSAQVKSYIVAMSHYMADIREKEQEYIGGTISITELKEYINSRFDVKSIINYILFCNVTGNYDGLNKNWQYITYDGIKWFVADYDNDGTFGNYFNGNMLMYPEDSLNGKYDSLLGNKSNIPSYWVYKYYKDELKAKYQVLKEHNVLTTDNIIRLFRDWISAVGADNYEREYAKWTYQPCYRDPNINTEYWERASFTEAGNTPPVYDETVTYAVGDFVRVKDAISTTVYFVFKCIKANTGQPVLNGLYPSEKPSFGHYDSIYRIKNWLDRRIEIFESMLSEL